MSDERIKPCPFCGGEAEMMGYKRYWVACMECGAERAGAHETKAEAIKTWNTRKPMERIVERLEERYNDIPIQYETSYEEGLGDGIDYAISLLKGGGVDEVD